MAKKIRQKKKRDSQKPKTTAQRKEQESTRNRMALLRWLAIGFLGVVYVLSTFVFIGYSFTGLVCLWAIRSVGTLCKEGKLRKLLGILLSCAAILAGFLLAEHVLVCDYAGQGVLAIVVIWLLRRWPVPAFIAGTLVLSFGSAIKLYALFMVPPIALYNGQRGRAMKIGPYLFYPLHLLLLWLITMLLLKQPVALF
jgi:hypothetical protein